MADPREGRGWMSLQHWDNTDIVQYILTESIDVGHLRIGFSPASDRAVSCIRVI